MVFPNGKLIFQIPTYLLNPYTLQSNKNFHYAAAKMHRKAQYIALRSPQKSADRSHAQPAGQSADRSHAQSAEKRRLT